MNISEELKQLVWDNATVVPGFDIRIFRKDPCGAWVVWDKYGVSDNMYGWTIDHIIPVSYLRSIGISDDRIDNPINLRIMQYRNNVVKSDNFPSYSAIVTSEKNKNIIRHQDLRINNQKLHELRTFFGF
jgi:hypothetical protein